MPLIEHSKRIQEKDSIDKVGNDDTSADIQSFVNELSYFNEHTKELQFKTLLQAVVGILYNSKASRCK